MAVSATLIILTSVAVSLHEKVRVTTRFSKITRKIRFLYKLAVDFHTARNGTEVSISVVNNKVHIIWKDDVIISMGGGK